MLLRKYILGATIESVSLLGFERIIKFDLNTKNDFFESVSRTLYVEVMGKYSNIILCEDQKILGALKTAPLDISSKRILLSGQKYSLPIPQDKAEILDKNQMIETLSKYNGGDFGEFLFNNVKGLCQDTAREIASNVNFTTPENTYDELYKLIIETIHNPTVNFWENKGDFYVFDYQTKSGNKLYFNSILDAQDYFYTAKEQKFAFNQKFKKLNDIVLSKQKKLTKKMASIDETIFKCKDLDTLKLKGELITSYIYLLKKGMKFCELENYYDENNKIKILLDENLTPSENAQRYFKKYAKEKRTLEVQKEQKNQLIKELDYVNSLIEEISLSENVEDLSDVEEEFIQIGFIEKQKKQVKKQTAPQFRKYNVLGFKIYVGKNNVQNDKLLNLSSKDDLWLHTKDYHSSHVIIFSENKKIEDKVIEISAEICAYFSKATNGNKVPVDYTLRKFVKKQASSGLGKVIYTDYKTCFVEPNKHEELISD